MKKLFQFILGVVLIMIICVGFYLSDGLSEGIAVSMEGIVPSEVPDGYYRGVYDFKRWSNTVEVQVRDQRIVGIVIVYDLFGAEITNCSAEIIQRVIETQDTRVDVVVGATITSKAYLKAIENAFR